MNDDGAPDVTIDANELSRVINITSSTADTTLQGLTITGGRSTEGGGGIRSAANLTITDSLITGNAMTAQFKGGGGIRSLADLTIIGSTVSGNSTAGRGSGGGGIDGLGSVSLINSTVSGNSTAGSSADGAGIYGRTVTLTNSTVSGNSTTGDYAYGGGLMARDSVVLENSTVSGNSTSGYGARAGGIASFGTASLTNSTVSGNSTSGMDGWTSAAWAGGIWTSDTLSLTNSIVLGNVSVHTNLDELLTGTSLSSSGLYFSGLNIVGEGSDTDPSDGVINAAAAAVFASTEDNHGVNAGVLDADGTIKLLRSLTNPALDAGDDSLTPGYDASDGPGTDQLGNARVDLVNVPNNGTNISDLGAVELQGGTIEFDVEVDAFVRGGRFASTNYGAESHLVVKNDNGPNYNRESYVRFNLGNLSVDAISSATLRLTPTGLGEETSSSTLRIRLVADSGDSWTEDGIHWNNRPTGSGLEILLDGSQLVEDETVEIDVTSLLEQESNVNGLATFQIDVVSEANTRGWFVFASQENSDVDARPTLLVTTRALENAAPTAVNDSATVLAGHAQVIDVLANDSDTDGTIQVTSVEQGNNGSVVINADGTVTYTPDDGFTGSDSFDYTIIDNQGATAVATVSVNVVSTISVEPLADAYVRGGSFASDNYGSEDTLVLKNDQSDNFDRESYLKFDLSNFAGAVTAAHLNLHTLRLGSAADSMTLRIRLVNDAGDAWSESSINFQNRPTGEEIEITIDGSQLVAGQALSIDVTSLLNQSINTNSTATFQIDVISTPHKSGWVTFGSKENSDANVRPSLSVATSGVQPGL